MRLLIAQKVLVRINFDVEGRVKMHLLAAIVCLAPHPLTCFDWALLACVVTLHRKLRQLLLLAGADHTLRGLFAVLLRHCVSVLVMG